MPTPQDDYINQHIDDADLCERFPNYKDRLHELERQYVAGKLREPPADGTQEEIAEDAAINQAQEAEAAANDEAQPSEAEVSGNKPSDR